METVLLMPVVMRAQSTAAASEFETGVTFTRVTTGELVNTPAAYWGGAWGDHDGDGWLDFFVGAPFSEKRNFPDLNNRDGTFTRAADVAMPKVARNRHGVAGVARPAVAVADRARQIRIAHFSRPFYAEEASA